MQHSIQYQPSKYKLQHWSTVTRQAARISNLKTKQKHLEPEITSQKADNLILSKDLVKLQEKHKLLQLKFEKFRSMHATVCMSNLNLNQELKTSKEEVLYLTDKMMVLEELNNDLNAVESKIGDPDFQLNEEIDKIVANFDSEKEFPEILVRQSTSQKKINPVIHLGIILIRQIGRVSLENTMPLFLALANSVFGQNWNHGNFKHKSRQRHALPPTSDNQVKAVKNI